MANTCPADGCPADQCCARWTAVSLPADTDWGDMASFWGGSLDVGSTSDNCLGIADLEGRTFNADGQIDNYTDLGTFWDSGEPTREFFNSLLPDDKKLDLADGATLDDWIDARGSTVEDQQKLMMTIACLGGKALVAGSAAVLAIASLL